MNKKSLLKETWVFLSDIIYNAVIIIALVVVIRGFIISPFRVVGESMASTLHSNEFILIDKFSYLIGEPDRGDPIVFLPPVTGRYPHKFEGKVVLDETGRGRLELKDLQTKKNTVYCQKKLLRSLWFCNDGINAGDLIYLTAESTNTNGMEKREITQEEVAQGFVSLSGSAGQMYQTRIYNQSGDDYFVKRIIALSGDTLRIENGHLYLKKEGEENFTEVKEIYLNAENNGHTYFPKDLEENTFVVPEGRYFVLGDNRNHSNDSRSWFSPLDQVHTPYISRKDISGKVSVVLWPLTKIRLIGGADL